MNVLVDTCIWSLALRRSTVRNHPLVGELTELIREGRALMLGLVRQELLSGVRTAAQFESLRTHLRAFPDVPLQTSDHEEAASLFNECRARGVHGTSVDLLICAVAARRRAAVFTTDDDFVHYARVLPLALHVPRTPQ